MSSDLKRLETWVEPLLQQFSPAERKKLTGKLATGLRQRQAARIKGQKNPDGSAFAARKKQLKNKSGSIKKRAKMFEKLRDLRHLQKTNSATGFGVGYSGKDARIAQVHQEGLTDKVNTIGSLFKYPARKLLGLSADDHIWLMDQLEKHLIK